MHTTGVFFMAVVLATGGYSVQAAKYTIKKGDTAKTVRLATERSDNQLFLQNGVTAMDELMKLGSIHYLSDQEFSEAICFSAQQLGVSAPLAEEKPSETYQEWLGIAVRLQSYDINFAASGLGPGLPVNTVMDYARNFRNSKKLCDQKLLEAIGILIIIGKPSSKTGK